MLTRHLLPTLLLLLGIGILPARGSAAPIGIAAIGDSLTAGVAAGNFDNYVQVAADLLGGDFALSNLGIGGSTVRNWLPGSARGYFEDVALPHLPSDLVTILLGTNDGLLSRPADVFAADMSNLLGELLAHGAGDVILMTLPGNVFTGFGLQLAYRNEILGICSTTARVHCGPDLFPLIDPATHLLDGLHPNAAGNALIGSALAASIRATVPEPSSASLVASVLAGFAWTLRRRRPAGPSGRAAAKSSMSGAKPRSDCRFRVLR